MNAALRSSLRHHGPSLVEPVRWTSGPAAPPGRDRNLISPRHGRSGSSSKSSSAELQHSEGPAKVVLRSGEQRSARTWRPEPSSPPPPSQVPGSGSGNEYVEFRLRLLDECSLKTEQRTKKPVRAITATASTRLVPGQLHRSARGGRTSRDRSPSNSWCPALTRVWHHFEIQRGEPLSLGLFKRSWFAFG